MRTPATPSVGTALRATLVTGWPFTVKRTESCSTRAASSYDARPLAESARGTFGLAVQSITVRVLSPSRTRTIASPVWRTMK